MKRAEISEKFAYARAARKIFEEICLDMYGPVRLSARGHLGGVTGGGRAPTTPCYFVSRIPRYRALSVAHAGGAHEDRLANYLPPVVSHRWLKVSTHSTRMHPSLRGSSRSRRVIIACDCAFNTGARFALSYASTRSLRFLWSARISGWALCLWF